MTIKHFTSLCLGLAAGAMSLLAAPGVALTFDAADATSPVAGPKEDLGLDEGAGPTVVNHASPHVTLIHFDADRNKTLKDGKTTHNEEVNRFVKDVTPWLPEMIANAMKANGQSGKVAFPNAVYTGDLFGKGLKGYQPGPVCVRILKAVNQDLNAFVDGKWSSKKAEGKASFSKYELAVTGTTTVGNYSPHMSVTAPSTYWGTANPVKTLTVYLTQGLTVRWHR